MCSIAEYGFSDLHMRTWCLFTFPWGWKVASSLQINFSAKASPSKWCRISVQNCKRWALSSLIRACSNCSLVWLHPQAFAKNSPQGRLWDTQLSTCSVSGLQGAALKGLPPSNASLSSEGPGRPGHFAMHRHDPSLRNFLYHFLTLFLAGVFLPNLVRKRRCTGTTWLRSCVLKDTKSLLCPRQRHFHPTCSPGGQRRN